MSQLGLQSYGGELAVTAVAVCVDPGYIMNILPTLPIIRTAFWTGHNIICFNKIFNIRFFLNRYVLSGWHQQSHHGGRALHRCRRAKENDLRGEGTMQTEQKHSVNA